MEKIIIIGGGGHGKSVIDAIRAAAIYEPIGIVDPGQGKGIEVLGVPVLGGDELLEELLNSGIQHVAMGLGSKGDNKFRRAVYGDAKKLGFEFPSIVHPRAIISDYATISEGCQIMAGAVINANASIGFLSVINTGSIVEHDCVIGSNVFTGPGAIFCGSVIIGDDTFIGSNACIVPEVKIGRSVFVPAHSRVTNSLSDKLSTTTAE